MSKKEEKKLLDELKHIVNGASRDIDKEWQALQIKLLTESRQLTQEVFEQDNNVKALLCVGQLISQEQFEDKDDAVATVGPTKDDYKPFGSESSPHYCRMQPAVGVKSIKSMLHFLHEKSLVCSLYHNTNYVSLLLHAKFDKSEMLAMTAPQGITIILDHKDKGERTFYLSFDADDEDKERTECYRALNNNQREMIIDLIEAQVIPRKLKKDQPKMWALMIETLSEAGRDAFGTGEDDDGYMD